MSNAQEVYAEAVKSLPTSERLRLAAMILNELTQSNRVPTPHEEIAEYAAAHAGAENDSSTPTGAVEESRYLIYGEFRGARDRMSTEKDFRLTEWHPIKQEN